MPHQPLPRPNNDLDEQVSTRLGLGVQLVACLSSQPPANLCCYKKWAMGTGTWTWTVKVSRNSNFKCKLHGRTTLSGFCYLGVTSAPNIDQPDPTSPYFCGVPLEGPPYATYESGRVGAVRPTLFLMMWDCFSFVLDCASCTLDVYSGESQGPDQHFVKLALPNDKTWFPYFITHCSLLSPSNPKCTKQLSPPGL